MNFVFKQENDEITCVLESPLSLESGCGDQVDYFNGLLEIMVK